MGDSLARFFDVPLAQQLVATFVGVAFGVPVALWLNRLQQARETTASRVARAERRNQLVAALKRELEFNREQLVTIARADQLEKIEAAPLSFPILEGTAPLRHELLDFGLCSALDETHYLLRAVDGFQRQHLALLFDPTAHVAQGHEPPVAASLGLTTFYLARAPKLRAHLKDAVDRALVKLDDVLKRFTEAVAK